MPQFVRIFIVFAVVLGSSAGAAERLAELEPLIGSWKCRTKLAVVESSFRWALDRQFIEHDHSLRVLGRTNRVKELIGWDPSTKSIVGWIFTNNGVARNQYRKDGKTWKLEALLTRNNSTTSKKVKSLEVSGDKLIVVNASAPLNEFLRLEFQRKAAAAATGKRADRVAREKGSLVICGGGALPRSVLARFTELAGGKKGRLVVIPTASRKVDKEALIRRWKERGIQSVTVLHAENRAKSDSPEFVAPLANATAVWFGGGQQSRLAAAYLNTATEKAILALYRRGGVVGGSSAGAAIQSRVMIQSGNPIPKIAEGIDLLPGCIVDQHFLRRNRFNRLLTAVGKHRDRLGIGLDEGTAIVYQQGKCTVLGSSYVTVIAAQGVERFPSIQTFRSGQSFSLDRIAGRK